MAATLGQLDIFRVRLEDPDPPATDPLHGGVRLGALGQAGDLGGGSSHAGRVDPGLDAFEVIWGGKKRQALQTLTIEYLYGGQTETK